MCACLQPELSKKRMNGRRARRRRPEGLKRVHIAATVLLAALILGFIFASWLSRQIPARPRSVAANAVFLWASNGPLPVPRHGTWLSCAFKDGHDLCILSSMKGKVLYEGQYATYHGKRAVSQKDLAIDSQKSTQFGISLGYAVLPYIYLKDGQILCPVEKYGECVRFFK